VAAFDRLNGMFAFALYDSRSGDAYLVRDPFGIKPLYYAATADGVLFSSELQTLLATDGVDDSIDATALQAYLKLDFVPGPLSIVRGVRKLEGGSFLRVGRDAQMEIERYFVRRPAIIDADAVAQLGHLLDAAVERHLIADVPVGVFLSGGIDSSLVAHAASRLREGNISTFSIGFQESSFDELRHVEAVARQLGLAPLTRTLSGESMLGLVRQIGRLMGEPLADGSIYPTYLLAQFAREHVTVALSGDGADELFAGYPTYFAHDVVRRMPGPIIALLRRAGGLAHRTVPVSLDNLSPDYKLKKFLDGMDPDLLRRHIRWMGTFAEEDLPSLLVHHEPDADRELSSLLAAAASDCDGDWLERLLRTDQRFYLQDGVLVKVDRASMVHSLEVRVPFLDRTVVAFADGLSGKLKLRGATSKVILRRLAEMRTPVIAHRPKKGFGAPLGHWFRNELRPMLEDVLSPRAVGQRGIFEARFVARLLDDHWSGRRDNRKQIFNLLTFALWYDNFSGSHSVVRADAA
ncbi:MAG TPA: asparagine synthase (glutamine-hydrolyzing), partial [Thermoanaerobaculia bacterium]|nr:asparagine synthase (glutamine-hydrolyzing) [Thermoanaerobaculia bacterium]